MKIAINTRFLLKNRLEGIGRYTYEVCKRLVKNHPEVQFHFLFDRPFDSRYIFGDNVTGHVLYPPARHPVLWKYWFEWRVSSRIKRIGADVFFSPDGYLSLSSKVPTLMTTHDLAYLHYPDFIRNSHLGYFRKNVPLFHARADKITAVSESTKEDILHHFRMPETKVVVCPNGVDETFKPLREAEKNEIREQIAGGAEYIISIGAIHPRKNVERQILAFEQFKKQTNSSTKLVLAGRWAWNYQSIKDTLEKSAFKDSIVHLENVEDMAPILGAAKALCYPSLYEGFGLPIVEALKAEVPVITSNCSSMAEVAGNAAVLIDPLDTSGIAQAMKSIDKSKAKREELINSGKKQVNNYSWDKSAKLIMDELLKLGSS